MLNDIVIYIMSALTSFALGMNVMAWITYIKKGDNEDEYRNIDRERCTLEELQEDIRIHDLDKVEQPCESVRRHY